MEGQSVDEEEANDRKEDEFKEGEAYDRREGETGNGVRDAHAGEGSS